MRYAELVENDMSDDELFGTSSITLGLNPEQCRAVAQVLVNCRNQFQHDPEFEEMQEDDPEEWEMIYRDFNRAISAFGKCDPLSALAALQTNPINYDLDDWAMTIIDRQTGIKMWDLVDMDDPEIEAAFDRAQKEMRAAHTRYDGLVQEGDDASDEELFGNQPSLSGAKRLIYNAGRKILHILEQAWQNPAIQREYKEYQEAGDTDAMFDQVVRICKLPFKQVFVVDTIIREFAGMEGLNDFGWMIDQGEFNDLVDAWQRFRDDADIEHEDWFHREARDFTGGLK